MMDKEKQIRIALGYIGFSNITLELLDGLKGTTLYKQQIKKNINNLNELLEQQQIFLQKNGFYDNGGVEAQLQYMEETAEIVSDIFNKCDLAHIDGLNEALVTFRDKGLSNVKG